MVTDRMTRKIIDVQKSTFDAMLNTMSNIQEQTGRATQAYFEQMADLPQAGVKAMGQWMDSMRETRNEFNSVIRDSFDSWGDMFERTVRQTGEAARQTRQTAERQGQ